MTAPRRTLVRKLEAMIRGYYFLAVGSAIILMLAGLSSLLVYRLASILVPTLFGLWLLGILCCLLRLLQILDAVRNRPIAPRIDVGGKKHVKHTGIWIAADVPLILLSLYPLFPVWTKLIFLASAVMLLLCVMLWNSQPYREFKSYSQNKEERR